MEQQVGLMFAKARLLIGEHADIHREPLLHHLFGQPMDGGDEPEILQDRRARLGHQRPRILEGLLQEGIHLGERRPDLRGSVIETLESLT